MSEKNYTPVRCSQCLMPTSAPGIILDENGVCNVCREYQPVIPRGEAAFLAELKYSPNESREYDCVVPISGGLDSVYTGFYLTRHLGLRCLGVHYDHGMGSDNKPKMLGWIEQTIGMPIAVHQWPKEKSQVLVRESIRALLPFGAKSIQAALCRHCGYGIRAAVFSEMVKYGLHSVWGKHTMDHIPFRYCQDVKTSQLIFQRNGSTALRSFRERYRQSKAIKSPGTSPLKLLFTPMGYPSLPKSQSHLKSISFYQYIPWHKQHMLEELRANGVDIQPLMEAHSDCRLPPVVDRVLQSAWTVGKKEIYICNMVRVGQLSKEEGMEQIKNIHETKLDTTYMKSVGLSDIEIEGMFK